MRRIDYIILHCTAGPQKQSTSEIKSYWKYKLGWKNPGYHYIIDADGSYEKIHPIESPSNGVAGFNSNSIHISYKGGVNQNGQAVDNRTAAQKATQIVLIKMLRPYAPNAKIRGHKDFLVKGKPGWKACPSFDVIEWCWSVGIDPK